MTDIKQELGKLIKTFNSQRVISEGEIQGVLKAIITILSENKKGVEALNTDTRSQLELAKNYIETQHQNHLTAINGNLNATKSQIEQDTKAQNDRAFKRLQTLIAAIKMPKDGKDGQDGKDGNDGQAGVNGSPDTAGQIRDKLETLQGSERLDISAIKGWEILKTAGGKIQQMIVGGFRFLEQLYDVAVLVANHRQDLLLQYDNTNKKWHDGIALTVSDTAPTNPQVNDLWVDIS